VSEETTEPDTAPAHGLPVILRSAVRGTDADFGLVALRVDQERLTIHAATGPLAEDMVGNLMRIRDSVAASVFLEGEPLLVPDYPWRGGAAPEVRARIGSVAVVPLWARNRVEGALAVGRLRERPPFTPPELDQLDAFVQRVGTARELADAREERRTARLVEDRARIRDDLHDHVIQELFAAGMALQAVAAQLPDPEHRRLVLNQIDALDGTTNRIRSLINDMPSTGVNSPSLPLPKRLVAIVDSLTPALRCLPTVSFTGPVESSVGPKLAEDLEAALREALSNVARHAGASSVRVTVTAADDQLVLDVIDDGRGMASASRTSGLEHIRRRASRHGGELILSAPDGGGTHLCWMAKLDAELPADRPLTR
jgi:signal transduction histidine kinase